VTTDAELPSLIQRARGGEHSARAELLERFYPFVYQHVRARLGADLRTILESGDLVHEGLVEALRGLDGFRGTTEAEMRAWFAMLVENRIRQAARRRRTAMRDPSRERALDSPATDGGRRPEPESVAPTPSENVSGEEERARLLACLEGLDEPFRRVIELRHGGGFEAEETRTWEQVSSEMGSPSADAARMLYQRAKIELRKRMGG